MGSDSCLKLVDPSSFAAQTHSTIDQNHQPTCPMGVSRGYDLRPARRETAQTSVRYLSPVMCSLYRAPGLHRGFGLVNEIHRAPRTQYSPPPTPLLSSCTTSSIDREEVSSTLRLRSCLVIAGMVLDFLAGDIAPLDLRHLTASLPLYTALLFHLSVSSRPELILTILLGPITRL